MVTSKKQALETLKSAGLAIGKNPANSAQALKSITEEFGSFEDLIDEADVFNILESGDEREKRIARMFMREYEQSMRTELGRGSPDYDPFATQNGSAPKFTWQNLSYGDGRDHTPALQTLALNKGPKLLKRIPGIGNELSKQIGLLRENFQVISDCIANLRAGTRRKYALGTLIGTVGGAVTGGVVIGLFGGAVASFIPGLGTAAGGVVGTAAGIMLGANYGGEMGRRLVKAWSSRFDKDMQRDKTYELDYKHIRALRRTYGFSEHMTLRMYAFLTNRKMQTQDTEHKAFKDLRHYALKRGSEKSMIKLLVCLAEYEKYLREKRLSLSDSNQINILDEQHQILLEMIAEFKAPGEKKPGVEYPDIYKAACEGNSDIKELLTDSGLNNCLKNYQSSGKSYSPLSAQEAGRNSFLRQVKEIEANVKTNSQRQQFVSQHHAQLGNRSRPPLTTTGLRHLMGTIGTFSENKEQGHEVLSVTKDKTQYRVDKVDETQETLIGATFNQNDSVSSIQQLARMIVQFAKDNNLHECELEAKTDNEAKAVFEAIQQQTNDYELTCHFNGNILTSTPSRRYSR